MPPQVGVGVAAFIFNFDLDQILMIKRMGSHGAGTWSVPGGWVEAGESLEEAAIREVKEEVGLDVEYAQEFGYTEDHFSEGVHDICFSMVCKWSGQVHYNLEPDKIDDIKWFKIGQITNLKLFLPMRQRVDTGDFHRMYKIFKEVPQI